MKFADEEKRGKGNKGKRLTVAEKKRVKVDYTTPIMIRIGKWFGRRESTYWTMAEAEALEQISPMATIDSGEIEILEEYYTRVLPAGNDPRRRDLLTLLNNWYGEIDRAKANPVSKGGSSLPEPPNARKA